MFLVLLIWFPSYVIYTYSMDSMLEIETYIFKEYLLLFQASLRTHFNMKIETQNFNDKLEFNFRDPIIIPSYGIIMVGR